MSDVKMESPRKLADWSKAADAFMVFTNKDKISKISFLTFGFEIQTFL